MIMVEKVKDKETLWATNEELLQMSSDQVLNLTNHFQNNTFNGNLEMKTDSELWM